MRVLTWAAAIAAAAAALPAQDPTMQERMRALEERNARLEKKVEDLTATRTAAPVGDQGPAQKQPPPTADQTVQWKGLTRSGDFIKFYGFFRLDNYYDTARANSVVLPAYVLPENVKANDDQFEMDPRLTRFGFDIDAGSIGDAKLHGKLETDFANFPTGSTESRATPRIRLAYMDIDVDQWHFRLGQDWDVISPLYPSVNGELLMWNAGNLGDRRPQIQCGYDAAKTETSSLTIRGSLGLTGAIDNQDLDGGGATSERDGFDAGIPHGQLRIGGTTGSWVEKQKISGGVWGALGRLETDMRFNGENRFTIGVAGIDLVLPITDTVQLRTEHWIGETLADFRGGIGQALNTATGEEIHSHGGWAELVWDASACLRLVGGGSYDDPRNSEVPAGGRRLNWTGYTAAIVTWGSGLKTGFETIYWETDWGSNVLGNMVRFDLYAQLDW